MIVGQPSPGAAIRPLGRRRNGGWDYLSLAGRGHTAAWPPPQWRLGLFWPSPGGRIRALGRRRNGGW